MLIAFAFHGTGRTAFLLALAALAVGTGVAPLVVTPAFGVLGGRLPATALVLLAGGAAATSIPDGLAAAVLLAGAVGFLGAATRLAFDAYVQEQLPRERRGGRYARYETWLQIGWVVGAAVGSLADRPLAAGGYVVAGIALVGLIVTPVVPRFAQRATKKSQHVGSAPEDDLDTIGS